MEAIYTQTPQNVVIDVVRSLGWLEQVHYPDANHSFTYLYCRMTNRRPLVACLMTYVIDLESPCSDLVPGLDAANDWNRIYGGPELLYVDHSGEVVLRTGIAVHGIIRECIRALFLSQEYKLDNTIPSHFS